MKRVYVLVLLAGLGLLPGCSSAPNSDEASPSLGTSSGAQSRSRDSRTGSTGRGGTGTGNTGRDARLGNSQQ
jgi:hypothetical protein